MVGTPEQTQTLFQHLEKLYGEAVATQTLPRIESLLDEYAKKIPEPQRTGWDQRDVILITYADQVRQSDAPALEAQRRFLVDHGYEALINTVHLLPFYPYTSDDGFSVVDYKQVDPISGDWDDVNRLANHFNLAFDLVANHCSQKNEWFQKYLAGEAPYDQFFMDVDPETDLSQVVRPRALPLLSPFESATGTKHVWTTFSPDQVDLNYGSPEVLLAMLDVLLFYVENGARVVRLDAIAFLWKEIGTNCLHLEQTHEAVKLMRTALEVVAPQVLVLTETNVPHQENISYFGNADEAHMVYQFSLPPLLYDAFLSGDASTISNWMDGLYDIPEGTTYFNFTASHDGIGVRPLEGLVPDDRIDQLVEATNQRGGRVGMRTMPDGSQRPYELNITYVNAMGDPAASYEVNAKRFLTSQAIMLAMKGIPGVYFQSLVGTENHQQGVADSGINRRINRRKFDREELDAQISSQNPLQYQVFVGYQKLIQTRIEQPAFHPDGNSEVFATNNPGVLGFLRTAPDQSQRILVLANLTDLPIELNLGSAATDFEKDLISGQVRITNESVKIEPFEVLWLTRSL